MTARITRKTRTSKTTPVKASRRTPKVAEYTEDSIQHFKGLEGVRRKPAMYLGERGSQMVFRCLKEAVDNCYDEYASGRNTSIEVYADPKTNTYIVADKAQGIPVGIHKTAKISTLTLILTELHAGGKFNSNAYKTASGTHGIGVAACNAVSESLEVWTFRDRVWHYQAFKKGIPVAVVKAGQRPPKDVTSCLKGTVSSGTIIRFRPDPSIVSTDGKTKATLDINPTAKWLRNLAMMNKGLSITFSANGKSKTYLNKVGIVKVLSDRVEKEQLEAMTKPLVYEDEVLSVAVQWTSYMEEDGLKSYVSSSATRDGGTHVDEFYEAMTKSLSKFKTTRDKYSPRDLRNGLVGVLNYKMSQPEFSSQVKDRLTSNLQKDVFTRLLKFFDDFFTKHKAIAKKILKRASDVKKTKEEFSKLMKNVTQINQGRKGVLLPAILASARCSPDKREIFFVEGGSAKGSATKARDSSFQEVLALTGKFSNAIRTPLAKLLKSTVVQNILVSIGYNYKLPEPASNLRVQRIYFLSDADPDGAHINTLLASLIYRLMPQLYTEGRVFVVNAPLFSSFYKGQQYFGQTFVECYSQMPKGAPKEIVTRNKGLGEMNPEVLEVVAFNPVSRNVIQLSPIKGKEEQYFLSLMGSETTARKILLGV